MPAEVFEGPDLGREATDEECKLVGVRSGWIIIYTTKRVLQYSSARFVHMPMNQIRAIVLADMGWAVHRRPPGPTLDALISATPLEERAARRSATDRTEERSAQAKRQRATLPRHAKAQSNMRAPNHRGTGRKR